MNAITVSQFVHAILTQKLNRVWKTDADITVPGFGSGQPPVRHAGGDDRCRLVHFGVVAYSLERLHNPQIVSVAIGDGRPLRISWIIQIGETQNTPSAGRRNIAIVARRVDLASEFQP